VNDLQPDSFGLRDVTISKALTALRESARLAEKAEAEEASDHASAGSSLQERVDAVTKAEQLAEARDYRHQWKRVATQLGLSRPNNAPACDNTEENCRKIIEYLFLGRLWFDAFTRRVLTTIDWKTPDVPCPPRPWTDVDDEYATMTLQRVAGPRIKAGSVRAAVTVVAHSHQRDCVVDWLNSLKWDGQRRLSTFFPRVLGTSTLRYHIRAGRNLLLSMVARALDPGCKVDEMIVLEGPQGVLKSTVWEVLGGDRYAELTANLDSKDGFQQFRGVWLGGISELSAMRRADVERVKAMVTCRVDRYRPSYARHEEDHPRRMVLVGTTNADEWLRDPTGNRRFIPIKVGKIDIEVLKAERDQLFAEAVHLYKQKQRRKWWIYPRLQAEIAREMRIASDPLLEPVRHSVIALLKNRAQITASSVMDAMCIPIPQRDERMGTRVGIQLRRLGGRLRRSTNGLRLWEFPGGVR
jgi:predicted P-loop ATPase